MTALSSQIAPPYWLSPFPSNEVPCYSQFSQYSTDDWSFSFKSPILFFLDYRCLFYSLLPSLSPFTFNYRLQIVTSFPFIIDVFQILSPLYIQIRQKQTTSESHPLYLSSPSCVFHLSFLLLTVHQVFSTSFS